MKKYEVLVETLVVIIAVIALIIVKAIPEIKKELGSSDHLLNTDKVNRLIDLKIDDTVFGYELSEDNKVVNIIFYDETSLVFYNKNLENRDLSKAISNSFKVLKSKDKLTDINVILTKYDDNNTYKKYFDGIKYSSYTEKQSTYNELKNKYKLTSTNNQEVLSDLNIKSKDFVVSVKSQSVSEYTDYIYKKLLGYQSRNNIENESKNNHSLDIQSIKINKLSNYPTSNSYYYIQDKKVYAYIEVTVSNLDMGYCYQGSLSNYKKGKC